MDDIVLNKVSMTELKKVVVAVLKNENVKIMLFGSRARGDNYPYSDVDIGILPSDKFDERKLILLRETIENLNFPYKMDIVNLSEISEAFKTEVQKDAILWKDWNSNTETPQEP